MLANIITLHNGLTRNTIEIDLNGQHCETSLSGMVIGDKNQQVDNFTSIIHNKPDMTPRLSEINLSIDTTLDTEGSLHES